MTRALMILMLLSRRVLRGSSGDPTAPSPASGATCEPTAEALPPAAVTPTVNAGRIKPLSWAPGHVVRQQYDHGVTPHYLWQFVSLPPEAAARPSRMRLRAYADLHAGCHRPVHGIALAGGRPERFGYH